jgi:hypothetical protein
MLFIAGAPWTNLAEIDIPGIQHWIQWKIGIKYILVLYGPRRETSAFPEKEA